LSAIFSPFSTGHRACLGKPLVYMELSIAIARLAWEYDMRLASQQPLRKAIDKDIRAGLRDPHEYHFFDFFLSNNEGISVEFRRR